MLQILFGAPGSGKTAALMRSIRTGVEAKRPGQMLIVPEQYSHEAERELCAVCGDAAPLYAEVLSFTGLARKVADEVGGSSALPMLDKGGRLLCMARAMSQIAPRLQVFSGGGRSAQLQQALLAAVDELKLACVSSETLAAAAAECGGYLGQKLSDLSLILSAYDAVAANGSADPTDRLTVLAQQIPASSLDRARIFIDGFTDFTAQEQNVIRALLKKGAEVTVCLTLDTLGAGSELYAAPRRTAHLLIADAEALNLPHAVQELPQAAMGRDAALRILNEHLFSYTGETFPDEHGALSLYEADGIEAECELAAAKALSLVRGGCRWRDVAVAARGFESYQGALERAFAHYGVPLYCTQRTDLLQKPLGALISAAYDVISGGWDSEDVIATLRTGLTALSPEDADLLENYALLWSVRGTMWTRTEPWTQHPMGYGQEEDDESRAWLARIDSLRREAARPLRALEFASKEAATARGQAMALARFFDSLGLAERLETLAQTLRADGREALAAEYEQIWEILIGALEQFAAILGETEMDAEGFSRLFLLMLSKYDVGTIPVSLDRVTAGELDRMRRRGVKHLIFLGCTDDRIPRAGEAPGVFSIEERQELLAHNVDIGGGREEDLWREYALAASALSLPDSSLTMVRSLMGAEGQPLSEAFFVTRAKQLFGLSPQKAEPLRCKTLSPAPALELAARAMRGAEDKGSKAAYAWYAEKEPEKLAQFRRRAALLRSSLSPERSQALFGQQTRLSASRTERYAACPYAFFLEYGLKAKPRRQETFAAPEIGTFIHAILEQVAGETMRRGGFKEVDDETLLALTDEAVERYIEKELGGLQDRSARFSYLFRRLTASARQIVLDMAGELRVSQFAPLDFELNFADPEMLPPVRLSDGETTLTLTGIADRVDGWEHEGKLYLRVVDYKTGRKAFSLSDVYYGLGLQMLLYLFALGKNGKERYHMEIVPAGVLYHPARDSILSFDADTDDGAIRKKRLSELRRSGLVLDGDGVLDAMDEEETKQYVTLRRAGSASGKGVDLAKAEDLGRLARHMEETLLALTKELREGQIPARPIWRTPSDHACQYCDYTHVCHFSPGERGDEARVLTPLLPDDVWARLKQEEGGDGNG